MVFDNLEINIEDDTQAKGKENSDEKQGKENLGFSVELTNDEIPLGMLGKDNPILHYLEINLFEDELNDNGLAQGNFR